MEHINNYISCLRKLSGVLLFSLLFTGCLVENPETTESGEVGVDPTSVQLNVTLNMNLANHRYTSSQAKPDKKDGYVHRFVVEAYLNRRPVAREVVIEEISNKTALSLPVSMRLHARRYQVVVWSDYVKADATTLDAYYNTTDLVPVVSTEAAHVANTPYKETFTAAAEADLSAYECQQNAQVPLDMELTSSMARYELVANDVSSFLKRVASGKVAGERFTVRVKYLDDVAEGYNVLDGVPRNYRNGMQYAETFLKPSENTQKLVIGFDYLFVADSDQPVSIPVWVEVMDEQNVLVAKTQVRIPCYRGRNTTIEGAFFTKAPNDGIGFDPDYDGSVDMDVTIK